MLELHLSPSCKVFVMSSCIFRLLAIAGSACLIMPWTGCWRSPDKPIRALPGPGFDLQLFDNSASFSRLLAVNASGAVLGMREIPNEKQTIFSQQYFYSDGQETIDLPGLEGFTNLEVVALSDDGKAVGFASRPLGHPEGSLTAIVWDSQTEKVINLGALPKDEASQAQSISADGLRISGYSTGSEPARMRPCVWTWNASMQQWDVAALPTVNPYNPFLLASGVVISPDGKRVAACATETILENNTVDSSLYVWDFADGQWTRRQVSKEQLRLHGINRDGVMVGDLNSVRGRMPCRIDLEGKITTIDLLPDDVTGEAWCINAKGTIVGFSDDAHGQPGGPQAFVWRDGKTEPLKLPEDTLYSAAYSINDRGQIAGLADVTFPDETIEDSQTGESEPLVKTLGFLWSAGKTP